MKKLRSSTKIKYFFKIRHNLLDGFIFFCYNIGIKKRQRGKR
nr:MAG TPA: hypothetical protein [Caudoviricetes sp.]